METRTYAIGSIVKLRIDATGFPQGKDFTNTTTFGFHFYVNGKLVERSTSVTANDLGSNLKVTDDNKQSLWLALDTTGYPPGSLYAECNLRATDEYGQLVSSISLADTGIRLINP